MTRTDVAVHDIATVLCALRMDAPDRDAVFVKALTSLVRFAVSEHELAQVSLSDNDLGVMAEIQARARQRYVAQPRNR
ncbi:MAG: hypothetical protein H7315_22815 [Herminiimonas sp.]|nr:hypothetical protein [Herminiimonas sp.]